MSAQRSKPKSHHGCLACKRRKVKCDEVRPRCDRCCKRGASCQYQLLPLVGFESSSSSSLLERPVVARADARSDLPKPVAVPEGEGPLGSSLKLQALNQDYSRSDFELLHHYTTQTYRSLASSPILETVWADTVPKEAFVHDFLLHGILALSALHLAHLRPSQTAHYHALAKHHHPLSIALFRRQLEAPSPRNGTALFVFATIAVFTAFSISFTTKEEGVDAIDELLGLTALQRGIVTVVTELTGSIDDGIFAPLVDAWKSSAGAPNLPQNIENALQRLEGRCRDSVGSGGFQVLQDDANAIEILRTDFRRALGTEHRLVALEWFISISEPFIAASKLRNRAAIDVLAHFGVLLHYLKDIWWIGDSGKKIVEEALNVMGDDCAWAEWARNEIYRD